MYQNDDEDETNVSVVPQTIDTVDEVSDDETTIMDIADRNWLIPGKRYFQRNVEPAQIPAFVANRSALRKTRRKMAKKESDARADVRIVRKKQLDRDDIPLRLLFSDVIKREPTQALDESTAWAFEPDEPPAEVAIPAAVIPTRRRRTSDLGLIAPVTSGARRPIRTPKEFFTDASGPQLAPGVAPASVKVETEEERPGRSRFAAFLRRAR